MNISEIGRMQVTRAIGGTLSQLFVFVMLAVQFAIPLHADISQSPLFAAKQIPGNLALVPSVEFPTVISVANINNIYSNTTLFSGYFDSEKCYLYSYSATESQRHFYPSRVATSHQCGGAGEWSGNFLNWAATQTIDPFRSALTGGYRVVDTPTETWLEKARSDRENTTNFPNRRIPNSGNNSSLVRNATPFNKNFVQMRIGGLGNKMRFSLNGNNATSVSSATSYNPADTLTDNTAYEVSVRVKVCVNGLLEANCKLYSQGYKPEGVVQRYNKDVRLSAFSYLTDGNIQRDGGVLRANQKFVGPLLPSGVANPAAEWNGTTGVLNSNPDTADATASGVSNSGVINYINKFGQLGGSLKTYDPVSELYYTAIRYFKNQGSVATYTSNAASYNDSFPVITNWNDPIQYACQKNVIIGIGDTNSHADRNLPGGVRSGNEPALPSAVDDDETVNVAVATAKVGSLEGVGELNANNSNQFGSCCNNNSAYIAGLAYDSHTKDIRPDLTGTQTITTHWVDVQEGQTLRTRSTNQYWLAAKYGGFAVPEGFGDPYARTEALPDGWWWTSGDMQTNGDKRPDTFYIASDAAKMISSLEQAFAAVVADVRASSSSIAANSTRLDSGTLIYQASFNGRDWSGRLRAYRPDSVSGLIDEDAPIWNTDMTLARAATGTAAPSRTILTANGLSGSVISGANAGINFSWSVLSADQRALLDQSDGRGEQRLNWLRGDGALEGSVFRLREHIDGDLSRPVPVLGDIVNSDPFFVGRVENYGYSRLPGAEGSGYPAFLSQTVGNGGKSNRLDMIYVGANDGMLHGFNALTGQEVFAYVPAGVFANLHQLTSPDYRHQYFVDGSPRAGDAYLSGQWHTVLLGATGAGGKSVFALDVTNPAAVSASNVMWEFSTDADDVDKLGIAMSQPSLARVRAGNKWVGIFGNGYESGDNIKLMVVDLETGALIRAIDTGVTGAGNGMAAPVPVDTNGDSVTDFIYAGDLQGNLWRFDLTAASSAGWSVSRLFRAVDDAGTPQPITSRPEVGRHPDGGLMIYFGTGKYFEISDNDIGVNPQVQSFYGIRDLNGAAVARTALVEQSIIFEGQGTFADTTTTDEVIRVVSNLNANDAPDHGWFLNLESPIHGPQGERVVSMPILRFGRIIFTSIIPNENPCGFGGESWLMELDAVSGGRLPYSALDINNDGNIDENDYVIVDGEQVPVTGKHTDEMIKTPGVVGAGEQEFKYTSGSSGSIGVFREKGGGNELGRQSWRQLQ